MKNLVRSFKLLAHTIHVTYPRTITCPDKGPLLGDCEPDLGKLKASLRNANGDTIPLSGIEHNRWHEQVHLMFHFVGRNDLYEDEALVDSLAGMLAQYEATVKRR